MSNQAEIATLNRLRGALKTKLTRLEKFLAKPIDQIDVIELKGKLSESELLSANFEEKQTAIEALVSDAEITAQYEERGDFEDRFSAAVSKAKRILITLEPVNQGDHSQNLSRDLFNNANTQLNPSTSTFLSLNDNSINLKLPALNLPTFSGSYEKWPGFSDTFKSSVHNDKRYSDSQKLVYLRSCLTEKAADKIESLETTDANYQVAWKILEKYYDDPTAVINNHIKSFFELQNCTNASATSIGDLLNNVTKHYRALQALNKPFLEAFPIFSVTSKLDSQTRLKWKEHIQGNTSPTMEDLLEFLHCRERVLETDKIQTKSDKSDRNPSSNNQNRNNSQRSNFSNSNSKSAMKSYATKKAFCHICKDAHFTQNCEKLLNVNLAKRLELIKNLNLCQNCFRSNHSLEDCKAGSCKLCNKKHHTLLHSENETNKSVQVNLASLSTTSTSQILLSTAIIHVLDREGNPHVCRALLDNGSQVHFMTERLAKKLNLNQRKVDISLGGVNQMSSSVQKLTHTTIQSRINKYSAELTFLVAPEINELSPSEPINKKHLKIPSNIQLADPSFDVQGEVDILIGSEIFLKLLCVGQLSIMNDCAILQKTYFGWILGGKLPSSNVSNSAVCNLSLNVLNKNITKFWEIENLPSEKILSNEENDCENHYKENTVRDLETGRYVVKLPFKENAHELGESYSRALKRFYSLERNLSKQPEHKFQYKAFMNEYIELGHMSENKSSSFDDGYFLPHHSIVKQSSLTTKLRIVFDASAKTSTGISLNDTLMVGPNIQEDLFSLLVRFRSHVYAVTADIEKMYRQTILHPNDRKYQKILWRDDPNQTIKTYTLNTVTYGTSPASFLATRSLVQLANDEANLFPNASIALREDFYMDDLLSGAQTVDEAKNLINELINVTRKGSLHLRQWASNEPNLIANIAKKTNDSHLCLNLGETTKTLGVYWNPNFDTIIYIVDQFKSDVTITKRTILSQIAQLFDPLGLLGPVILHAKILMQSLWLLNLDWDESVPQQVHTAWLDYCSQLPLLETVQINRKIVYNNYFSLQLHGFCDASEKAYGACIYLRSTNKNGEISTQLICSKSRVAPLKKLSLPRLELSSALLLGELFKTTSHALRRLSIEKTIFWSDSTIALHWINSSPHVLKTFEANRVAKIQNLTNGHKWRHVRTEYNPADLISRGQTPREFIDNSLWLNGPTWINSNEEDWPLSIIDFNKLPHDDVIKKSVSNLITNSKTVSNNSKNETAEMLFNNSGSFLKLIHVVAYCQRFIEIKLRKRKLEGILSHLELKRATLCIIKLLQNQAFSSEINILRKGQNISGNLSPLNPFLDSEGILRVGGRLSKSDLPYAQKHPIFLPKTHNVTNLIIRHHHLKLFHAGTQATLNSIRNDYLIVNGRNVVKNIIYKCITCLRAKPRFPNYVMGELPKDRTVFERAFKHTGIDYCGPIFIKEKKHRNRAKVKVYIAVFVCFATKAVHIEVVSDLSSEAFLAALKRFFSRRGKSSDLYSDNGTNFKGANREIQELYAFLNDERNVNEISKQLVDYAQINWHFIPPRSPHFGGLWEAAVKAFKHHFIRVIGERILTYEELTTFATEVEGILNSRPITPIPSDPNDLVALTPGHFLIGDSITNLPEHNLLNLPSNRLSSWQQIQQLKQHFWARWSKEYLNELTVRKKWHKGRAENIEIGKLVIVKEENAPPMRWSIGRIIKLYPGKDQIVRVVSIKTAQGEYKRSIKNLAPLPIDIS